MREHLAQDPWRFLQRTQWPFDGMTYYLSLVDPDNRLCEHLLIFHVYYGQDEERLIIANGNYWRRVGF
jgi:hypothetical protein